MWLLTYLETLPIPIPFPEHSIILSAIILFKGSLLTPHVEPTNCPKSHRSMLTVGYLSALFALPITLIGSSWLPMKLTTYKGKIQILKFQGVKSKYSQTLGI